MEQGDRKGVANTMKYYPINLDLRGKQCLVVGGGNVAARKVEGLVKAGANVTVLAPEVHPTIESVSHIHKDFEPEDVEGFFLVIAATSNADTNKEVSLAAHKHGVLVNVVDDKDLSDFIVPSIVDCEPLTISISTNGVAPFLSKQIRLELESKYGKNYSNLLGLIKKHRQKIVSIQDKEKKARIWKRIFSDEIFQSLENADLSEIDLMIEGLIDGEE